METDTLENSYRIKTGSFEGPFALLLGLIEERKLFINDVSLAVVTEDYIKYVNGLGKLDPVAISSFIIVAATLILIKSSIIIKKISNQKFVTFVSKKIEFRSLSNFFKCEVKIFDKEGNTRIYQSGEHCFHGEKYWRLA